MERKDTGKNILITILVIIIILLVGLIAFNLGKGRTNVTDNGDDVVDQNNSTEETEYKNYISENATLSRVIEKDIVLNGNKHKLAFVYSYEKENNYNLGEPCSDCTVYKNKLTVVYDGKLIGLNDLDVGVLEDEGSHVMPSAAGIGDIKIMKDTVTGKEYVVFVYYTATYVQGDPANIAVMVEEGNVLYKFREYSAEGMGIRYWLDDEPLQEIKINENNIMVITTGENCHDAYKEKVTIENGKLKTERIDFTGKITIAGGC